jgi:hypothetical protein
VEVNLAIVGVGVGVVVGVEVDSRPDPYQPNYQLLPDFQA